MGLKTKYQYTYFIHPYIVDKKKYDKYILRLLKDKRCKFKIFEKEKDMNIYNHFLPHFRNYIFPTFELRGEKLKDFNNLKPELKSKIVSKHSCACFSYDLAQSVKGKVDENNSDGIFFDVEKIEIICFNTGICFFIMKTNLENAVDFYDVLNFNYKFKDINSKLNHLRNFDNIRIQTDTFKDVKGISELITEITGIYKRKITGTEEELSNSRFYTFAYTCTDTAAWNEKNKISETDFYRYVNVLPMNYSFDLDKESSNHNIAVLDKYKYYKIGMTKLSSNLICSGIDTYNFTKLPFEYETEYFYTYIILLYQKMFLRKLNSDFKEYEKITKMRSEFILFTKQFWEKEITLSDSGTRYYNALKKVLELENLYDEIKSKYEIIYKELNIEKNNKYFAIAMMLLTFSLTLNTANIVMIMYLIS